MSAFDVYTIRDSARGDGITDDAPAFKAMIAAAQANGGGGISVDVGTYKLGSTITIPSTVVLMLQPGSAFSGTGTVKTSGSGAILDLRDGSQPVFNVKAYGAKGDGVADDTVAIQAALTAANSATQGGSTGATAYVPTGVYIVTSTLDWTHFSNVVMLGAGQNGDFIGGSVLKWNGAAGGTVIKMLDARDNLIQGIVMENGTATPGVYVDMYQSASPTLNCTHNAMWRCTLATFSTAGVRIGNTSTANCELNTFDDVTISGGPSGILIAESQSKYNRIIGGSIANCTTGGITTTGGSFTSLNTNFSANTVDINLGAITDTISIINPQSESAGRFLTVSNASAAWAITVLGGRLDTNAVNVDNNYIDYETAGPLNLIGVDFASGVNRPSVKLKVTSGGPAGASVNAIGCVFPNNTIWTGSSQTIRQFGCLYAAVSGSGTAYEDVNQAGIKIGTTPVLEMSGTQAAFFNAALVSQQNGTGNTHTVAAGSVTNVFINTTFDGSSGSTAYTVGDIVKALKNYGLLAA